jgi:fatty acyl-CoA reductase
MRSKKGMKTHARLDSIFSTKLFSSIREFCPEVMKKVHVVEGDVEQTDLGMTQTELNQLRESVSIVFHSAGNVKFEDKLSNSLTTNVFGVRNVVHFSKSVKNLEALVIVSTSFSNCNRSVEIEEKIYEPSTPLNDLLHIMGGVDEETLNGLTSKLIGSHPNPYTFSKCMAEAMLQQEGSDLPKAIVRPSAVAASVKEPFVGWIDAVQGIAELFIGISTGVIKTLMLDHGKRCDQVPVDLLVNCIISAAWRTANKRAEKKLTVYNFCSNAADEFTWGIAADQAVLLGQKYPLKRVHRYPGVTLTTNKVLYLFFHFFLEYIPAVLLDTMNLITGKRQIARRVASKVRKLGLTVSYMMTREWTYKKDNLFALQDSMTPTDRQIFDFDTSKITWVPFQKNEYFGIREHILLEDKSLIGTHSLSRVTMVHYLVRAAAVLAGACVASLVYTRYVQ